MDAVALEFLEDAQIADFSAGQLETFLVAKGISQDKAKMLIAQRKCCNIPAASSNARNSSLLFGGMLVGIGGACCALWDKLCGNEVLQLSRMEKNLSEFISSANSSLSTMQIAIDKFINVDEEIAVKLDQLNCSLMEVKTLLPTLLTEARRIKEYQSQEIMQELTSLKRLVNELEKRDNLQEETSLSNISTVKEENITVDNPAASNEKDDLPSWQRSD